MKKVIVFLISILMFLNTFGVICAYAQIKKTVQTGDVCALSSEDSSIYNTNFSLDEKSLYFSAKASNNSAEGTGENFKFTVLAAQYDNVGKLADVKLYPYELLPQEVRDISITVPRKNAAKYKFFIWGGAQGLIPYAKKSVIYAEKPTVDTDFYPGWLKKAVVFSYDDGNYAGDSAVLNILNKYGVKAAFNLCAEYGMLSNDNLKARAPDIYKGHEIANHSKKHLVMYPSASNNYTAPDYETCVDAIDDGRNQLEQIFNRKILGFVWAGGSASDAAVHQHLKDMGVLYARPTGVTGNFDIPDDFMVWKMTCFDGTDSDNTRKIKKYWDKFKQLETDELKLYSVWGHPWETDDVKSDQGTPGLDALDYVCSEIASSAEVWNPTCIEAVKYINANKNLQITDGAITNPSDTDCYAKINGEPVIIEAGETLEFYKPGVLDKTVDLNYFPGWNKKALTLSFDDGYSYDGKMIEYMNKYGLKGAFNLISEKMQSWSSAALASRIAYYKEHEVANHTSKSSNLYVSDDGAKTIDTGKAQIYDGRQYLQKTFEREIYGMVWPDSDPQYDEFYEYLRDTGVLYSRDSRTSFSFDLPEDFLKWKMTCSEKQLISGGYWDKFKTLESSGELKLLSIWGHSTYYGKTDSEGNDKWSEFEEFCKDTENYTDIWKASPIEIVKYVNALRNSVTADSNGIYNNSALTVYASVNGEKVTVAPNSTYCFFDN